MTPELFAVTLVSLPVSLGVWVCLALAWLIYLTHLDEQRRRAHE